MTDPGSDFLHILETSPSSASLFTTLVGGNAPADSRRTTQQSLNGYKKKVSHHFFFFTSHKVLVLHMAGHNPLPHVSEGTASRPFLLHFLLVCLQFEFSLHISLPCGMWTINDHGNGP